jgi:hypothetical protein
MAVPDSYMITANQIPRILAALQDAGVPARFNREFLKSLGFTSSNDRAIIGVLKSLGFLDQSGIPTDKYRAYRNKVEAPYILADAIRDAYSDVFLAHENAQTLPAERVRGILATRVDKGDAVLRKMAATFRALVGAAKWDRDASPEVTREAPASASDAEEPSARQTAAQSDGVGTGQSVIATPRAVPEYHYNIQIHLPATKDVSVYNAIFKSLREHLL